MMSLFDSGDDGPVGEHQVDFDSMGTEEFFDDLVRAAAAEVGTTVEGLAEMDLEDVDRGLGTEIGEPHHPRGAREGYRDTERLDVVSKADLERRRERVNDELGL